MDASRHTGHEPAPPVRALGRTPRPGCAPCREPRRHSSRGRSPLQAGAPGGGPNAADRLIDAHPQPRPRRTRRGPARSIEGTYRCSSRDRCSRSAGPACGPDVAHADHAVVGPEAASAQPRAVHDQTSGQVGHLLGAVERALDQTYTHTPELGKQAVQEDRRVDEQRRPRLPLAHRPVQRQPLDCPPVGHDPVAEEPGILLDVARLPHREQPHSPASSSICARKRLGREEPAEEPRRSASLSPRPRRSEATARAKSRRTCACSRRRPAPPRQLIRRGGRHTAPTTASPRPPRRSAAASAVPQQSVTPAPPCP